MIENYNCYRFNLKEKIIYFIQGFILTICISMLFYKSWLGVILICPLAYVYLKKKNKDYINARKWQLNIQFRDGITSLSAALSAGYSIEHAFEEALDELRLLYSVDSYIINEFNYLVNQIKNNITVEKALIEFGKRTSIEDIISFAEVFFTAKRTGGDLIKIIKTTCNTISDKIDVKREIITLITAKKYEANIMKLIPLGILGYLNISSPDFLDPLYHNAFGVVTMTVLLMIYLGAYMLTDKIIAIEV